MKRGGIGGALVAVALVACSGGAGTNATSDAAADDAAIKTDAASDGGSSNDGSTANDAFADAPVSDAGPLDPKPPAGFVRCGHGTLDATEGATACAKPGDPFLTKNVPERKCDAVTFTSAKWEVWCGNGPLYVWAKFEGMKSTGKYLGCQGYPNVSIGSAWLVLNTSASGMLPSPSSGTFDTKTSLTYTLGSLGNTHVYQSGTGTGWVNVQLPAACNASPVDSAVTAFEVTWDAANPG